MKIEAKAPDSQAFKRAMERLKNNSKIALNEEIARAALIIETNAKNLIRKKPKTGRIYKRGKNRTISHQASAPGEPPATDTGRLLSSIQHRLIKKKKVIEAYVGTNVEYGKFLEWGTSRMAPRPWLSVAVAMYSKQFASRLRIRMTSRIREK